MTIGVGDSSPERELNKLEDMTAGAVDISLDEFRSRIIKAQDLMSQRDIAAIYINAGSNLSYFTGTCWHPSERLVGAVIPRRGEPAYVAPAFERATLMEYIRIDGPIFCWQEHETPYELVISVLAELGITKGNIGIDDSAPFFLFDGLRHTHAGLDYVNAAVVTQACRMIKSDVEIALLQRAKDMTLAVQKTAAKILKPGICSSEVNSFIDNAHRKVGAEKGSSFCIVLFGEATAYPHGVKYPQILDNGDMVLIDTGCQLQGYNSDITRTYVYGEPNLRQRQVWDIEKQAQQSAFEAALPGNPCSAVDLAARGTLERNGFGPGYAIPGLPHRTGHGIGLDIHEGPYLVMNDHTLLQKGMCFSNEPMICIPGEFGVRHEDHFYITDSGPKWFTQPANSIDDPFGYDV